MSNFGPPGTNQGPYFNVNVRKSEDRPSFTMMALTIHEAKPGHALEVRFIYQNNFIIILQINQLRCNV